MTRTDLKEWVFYENLTNLCRAMEAARVIEEVNGGPLIGTSSRLRALLKWA
jgi:hypothetical protein